MATYMPQPFTWLLHTCPPCMSHLFSNAAVVCSVNYLWRAYLMHTTFKPNFELDTTLQQACRSVESLHPWPLALLETSNPLCCRKQKANLCVYIPYRLTSRDFRNAKFLAIMTRGHWTVAHAVHQTIDYILRSIYYLCIWSDSASWVLL